ncbi:MAG: DUF1848 domain-containing protein [Candidatus Weimeria sp.]
MIINTGMRTDIPAFYSRWFLNRIKAGYVLVRNPYNPQQVTRYRLSPDIVDMIGFCTKNPGPMLEHMDDLKEFGQYWFVTITPYEKEIEPNVPDIATATEEFRDLSDIVGIDSIGWRYDPVFLNEKYTVERHIADFEKIAERLSGFTKTCVISFIDLYPKVRKNFPEVRAVSEKDRITLGREFIAIGRKYGMTIKPCGEGDELTVYGADCSGCMTVQTCEKAIHRRLSVPKMAGARKECACIITCDIGAYNTCGHLCRYCYANYSAELVRHNMSLYDPDSPFLIGGSEPDDHIHEAVQKSWKDDQMSIFDFL